MSGDEIMPASVAFLALEELRSSAQHLHLAICYLEGIGQAERAQALREALHSVAEVGAEVKAVVDL
jgi:hypothetical protein